MTDQAPIRIFHGDTIEQVAARHRLIVERLERLGRDQVRLIHGSAGFPPQWSPIIVRWLASAAEAEAEMPAPMAPDERGSPSATEHSDG